MSVTYGVLAAAVAGRTREIGIRTALGANPGRLLAGVLKEGLTLSTIAVLIGAGGAWLLARCFDALLFGVAGSTPETLAVAALLLIGVAAGAALCRRAGRRPSARAQK